MGMSPKNIVIGDIGRVIEITEKGIQLNGTVPSGRVLVDGYGVGDVGSVVLRDRKHLAQDGMMVVVINLSSEDGSLVSGPDIITRGFVYVKESEELLTELRNVVLAALDSCQTNNATDWATIKSTVKKRTVRLSLPQNKEKPYDPSRNYGNLISSYKTCPAPAGLSFAADKVFPLILISQFYFIYCTLA
jgi:ribonuclease J